VATSVSRRAEVREPRGTKLVQRSARPMPKDLAGRVPHIETGYVELHAAVLPAQPLHDHLGLGYDLAAAVADLPVARAAPHAGDVVVRETSVGELVLDQEAKGGPIHDVILATLGVGPVPMTPLGLALWCASTLVPASSGWRSYLK
jgi:hypothetical protein